MAGGLSAAAAMAWSRCLRGRARSRTAATWQNPTPLQHVDNLRDIDVALSRTGWRWNKGPT